MRIVSQIRGRLSTFFESIYFGGAPKIWLGNPKPALGPHLFITCVLCVSCVSVEGRAPVLSCLLVCDRSLEVARVLVSGRRA